MLVICNCTKDQPLEISCLVSCYANIYIKNHLKLPRFTIPIHVWRYSITGALATALFIPFLSGGYHPYEQNSSGSLRLLVICLLVFTFVNLRVKPVYAEN